MRFEPAAFYRGNDMGAVLHKINLNLHKVMALPAFLLFAVFFIYPLARGIGISLTDWDGISEAKFIGLDNFFNFFKDERARNDIATTVLFALGSAPLLNVFGFLLALLLDCKLKGRNIARAIIYMPAVISPLIMGYIWYYILQPQRGYLATIAQSLNSAAFDWNWLGNSHTALLVIILVNVWQFSGMTMVIYLAGLQGIPEEIEDACRIDGAGYLQRLGYVIIPQLTPSIKINVVTNIIGSLSVFDVIMALTEGGPGYSTESLSIYIMRMCYGSYTGYSTAVAIILFLLILLPVVLFMRMMKSREFEM